jgi:hypothetical protein
VLHMSTNAPEWPGAAVTVHRPSPGRPPAFHGAVLFPPTAPGPHPGAMGYEVLVSDGSSELVVGADAYVLEGPLTTFFRTDPARRVVDCWSERLASFRTADVTRIRRLEG